MAAALAARQAARAAPTVTGMSWVRDALQVQCRRAADLLPAAAVYVYPFFEKGYRVDTGKDTR